MNDTKSAGAAVNPVHTALDFPKISSLQAVKAAHVPAPPNLVCPISHILGYDTPFFFDITTNFSFASMSTLDIIFAFDPS